MAAAMISSPKLDHGCAFREPTQFLLQHPNCNVVASTSASASSQSESTLSSACYERYEQEKAKLVGAYDICDLVTSCMTQVVDGRSYEGVKLSSLICDEVQDFTLSTVVLLLNLLENEDEFMCGGDTAQTICKVPTRCPRICNAVYIYIYA